MTTSFERVLKDVFENGAEVRFADPADEAAAIEAAKAGDESATIALVYAYGPTMRDAVARYRFTPAVWDGVTVVESNEAQEARALAVTGLLEAVHAHDPDTGNPRLAGIAAQYVTDALSSGMAGSVAMTVPSRTLTRFYGILNRAGRDVVEAERIAPDYAMTRETFRAILDAVRADRLEGLSLTEEGAERVAGEARPIWEEESGFAAAEDRIMVEAAFRVVDEREDGVIRDAYGFSEYRPLPDGVIAERRGMSRQTVQRTRSSGLGKMREVLAVDVVA